MSYRNFLALSISWILHINAYIKHTKRSIRECKVRKSLLQAYLPTLNSVNCIVHRKIYSRCFQKLISQCITA
ncbi:hypothetical protein LQ764DRAFT_236190 [Zygosaccharomyces rouxii]|nr:hypothetical protein LQ764DRAFT_236190 [Zygosaccharomyces rouxii]